MAIFEKILNRYGYKKTQEIEPVPGEHATGTTRSGYTPTPENKLRYMYNFMQVDPDRRAAVLYVRYMDKLDGRVKRIHTKVSRSAVKGGLMLDTSSANTQLFKLWRDFSARLHLNNQQKLESDSRGLVMEGNLALQWVVDHARRRVASAIRMPSETLMPKVAENGMFKDSAAAYEQYDLHTGRVIAEFPLWAMTVGRLDPDNFDDWGSMGRPFLDGSRSVWKKLDKTEQDLVINRGMRAPKQNVHVLENVSDEFFAEYRQSVENQTGDVTSDFLIRGKGLVTSVPGDGGLDKIDDVVYLLDTFFAGSPVPKELLGYSSDVSRDILEDLTRDYYEEVDAIQDIHSQVYEQGFKLEILLAGLDPSNYDFRIKFRERKTDTLNQRLDSALKKQALGYPREYVWATVGEETPQKIKEQLTAEANSDDPYPDPLNIGGDGLPKVSVTPGNGRKGDSATNISTTTRSK